MALLLDTTVVIDALRGHPAGERLQRRKADGDVPFVCAVTAEEVTRGLRPDEVPSAETLLRALRPAPLGLIEGEQAGRWRRLFAERGVTLSQADALVAAAAHSIGARLATGNPRDFPMAELLVEHWPVGA